MKIDYLSLDKFSRPVLGLYVALILTLSSWPVPRDVETGNDKINHALAFVVFAILARWAFRRLPYLQIFLWGLGFGVIIEFIQLFLPYRSTEFLDVAADCAGLAIGIIILAMRSREGDNAEIALNESGERRPETP